MKTLRFTRTLVLLVGILEFGAQTQPGWAAALRAPVSRERPFINSLEMRFVPLPGTNVLMSIWETRGRDFQTYLVASGQKSFLNAGAMHPAANLNWYEAVAFCRWLTREERARGNIGPEDRYRLPTDAEWDLAVGPAHYPWGEKWPPPQGAHSTGYHPDQGANTAPVGSFPPNALGIYDLGGNVFEWTQDWYYRALNPVAIRLEFKQLEEDGGGIQFKVLRGASWIFRDPVNLLSAYRYVSRPEHRGGLYGFRCVLVIEGPRPLTRSSAASPLASRVLSVAPPFTQRAIIEGRSHFMGRCSGCHQLFDPVIYQRESWEDFMRSMRGKAKLSGSEFEELQAFIKTIRTAD